MTKRSLLLCAITLLLYAWAFVQSQEGRLDPSTTFVVPPLNPDAGEAPRWTGGFVGPDSGLGMVHAASLCEMDDGRIAAVWYGGLREGGKDTALFFSVYPHADSGSWEPPRNIMDRETAMKGLRRYVKKIGNPVIFSHGKRLWLIYVTAAAGGWSGSSLNVSLSDDGGKNWAPSRRLHLSPFLNVSELVRNRPLRLSDGGFLIPIYHEMMGKFPEALWFRPEEEGRGFTYRKTRMAGGSSFFQPSIVPFDAASAVAFYRVYSGNRNLGRAATRNAGAAWSKAKRVDLPNPGSAVSGIPLAGGRILLAFNDSMTNRWNLRLAVSADGGLSWSKAATLDHEVDARFSYPYLIRTGDGTIHLLYTWKNRNIRHAAFNDAWVESEMNAYRDILRKSEDLAVDVHALTKALAFGDDLWTRERLQSAAVKIPVLIAEGKTRRIYKEALERFYDAEGTLVELLTQLRIARRLGYVDDTSLEAFQAKSRDLHRDLLGLIDEYR